jgi:hypothetical protein
MGSKPSDETFLGNASKAAIVKLIEIPHGVWHLVYPTVLNSEEA